MKYTITEALISLKPEAEWAVRGGNYSDIEWLDKFSTIYVRDKKEVLHYIYHPNIIDLTLKGIHLKQLTVSLHMKYQMLFQKQSVVRKMLLMQPQVLITKQM